MMTFETYLERLREIVDLQLAGRRIGAHDAVARLFPIDRNAKSGPASARSGRGAVCESVGVAQTDERALREIDRELARLFENTI